MEAAFYSVFVDTIPDYADRSVKRQRWFLVVFVGPIRGESLSSWAVDVGMLSNFNPTFDSFLCVLSFPRVIHSACL